MTSISNSYNGFFDSFTTDGGGRGGDHHGRGTGTGARSSSSSPTSVTNTAGMTESQRRICQLSKCLHDIQTSSMESGMYCDSLHRRVKHLDNLTSPASDASAILTQASENLASTLSFMKDAREKFDTVSDCAPAIDRLHNGARKMCLRAKQKQASRSASKAAGLRKAGSRRNIATSNIHKPNNNFESLLNNDEYEDDDDDEDIDNIWGHHSNAKQQQQQQNADEFASYISEQDVYAATDSMDIVRDSYDYFLCHKRWKSTPSTMNDLERLHKEGVDAMCLLITAHLTEVGPAVRMRSVGENQTATTTTTTRGGKSSSSAIYSHAKETALMTRKRLSDALANRDLMKSVGEYEDYFPLGTRAVRELKAVMECLNGDTTVSSTITSGSLKRSSSIKDDDDDDDDFQRNGRWGSYLGPKEKRPQARVEIPPNGKIVRTEKVGSGYYSNYTKKPLVTGFPHLDAYGESRKAVAFASIDGYYRHLKSELKKSAIRNRATTGSGGVGTTDAAGNPLIVTPGNSSSGNKISVDVDGAARDAVRCLEHAMVIVAGEKTIYRSIISPGSSMSQQQHNPRSFEDTLSLTSSRGATTIEFRTALIRSYSYVVSAVVDRIMDIIELVFFKEAGIGQAAASEMGNTSGAGGSDTPRMAVRTAAGAAAAGLRILDGVRILGPSLAKLCELSESRDSAAAAGLHNDGTQGDTSSTNNAENAALLAGQLCISVHRTTVKNCARTLENLSKAIVSDPLNGDFYRPPDCRVAPVTSDVVRAIKLMSPFGSAYKSVSKRRALPWDTSIGDDALDLDTFVKHLVMKLLSNLQSKAKNFLNQPDDLAHTAKAPLFMINNMFYLLEQIDGSNSNSGGHSKHSSSNKLTTQDDEQYSLDHASWYVVKVNGMYQAQKEIYLAHWDVLNHHLTTVDQNELQYEKKGQLLSLESGRLIKTRFSGFIEEFAELYQTHRPLKVIDAKLRLSLQNDVRNVFLPRYKSFFDKYARIQFSKKNQDQYLKYPPAKVDSLIGDLYEVL